MIEQLNCKVYYTVAQNCKECSLFIRTIFAQQAIATQKELTIFESCQNHSKSALVSEGLEFTGVWLKLLLRLTIFYPLLRKQYQLKQWIYTILYQFVRCLSIFTYCVTNDMENTPSSLKERFYKAEWLHVYNRSLRNSVIAYRCEPK